MSLANKKMQKSYLFQTAAVYDDAVEGLLPWQQYCCGAKCGPGGIDAPGLRHHMWYLCRCVCACDLQRQSAKAQISTRTF